MQMSRGTMDPGSSPGVTLRPIDLGSSPGVTVGGLDHDAGDLCNALQQTLMSSHT